APPPRRGSESSDDGAGTAIAAPRTMSNRGALGVVVACALVVYAGGARADVAVSTLEYGPWPDTIAALQRDVAASGREIHVVVHPDGRALACPDYALTLDDATVATETGRSGPTIPCAHVCRASPRRREGVVGRSAANARPASKTDPPGRRRA